MTGALVPVAEVNGTLAAHHYLGPSRRGFGYRDEYGVMVFANPSSRRLPQREWLELVRWCITTSEANAGSTQWSRAWRLVAETYTYVTTFVSYSDPAAGHDGALYRACNWAWAPTWHRLRPPPTGHGDWGTGQQGVKDRWVYPLRPDAQRAGLLAVQDAALQRRMPWCGYREGRTRNGWMVQGTAGGDYKRWRAITQREVAS